MARSSGEYLLMPLDPSRVVASLISDFERFSEIDPVFREAKDLLEDRLEAVAAEDSDGTLASLLWLHFTLLPPWIIEVIRAKLRNGPLVLAVVDDALDASFSLENLRNIVKESSEVIKSNPAKNEILLNAKNEISRIRSTEDAIPGFAVAVATAVVVAGGITLATYALHQALK